ncbi:MAG: translation initiation factor IF-3 [Chloroflexi bacterium]|nr:translation initiation factor IF-3 [Chloroflexota bacterium]
MRVNEEIRAREVRLVGEKGEQLGIMPLYQAREIAKNRALDLVEVAATAVPPVCRLLDYGRYRYEQDKKDREAKKSQKIPLLREVRLRPSISSHDLESKLKLTQKLLDERDKVRIVVQFRGREITHSELGWRLLQRVAEALKEVATVEGQPIMEGRRMVVLLSPVAPQKAKKAPETSEEEVKESENAKN